MPDGAPPSSADADENNRPPSQTETSRGMRAFLSRLLGSKPVGLNEMLHNGNGSNVGLTVAEREMIERIVVFDKKRVDDVAIPRVDIVAVPLTAEIRAVLKTFSDANHSRLPVYRGDLDDPVGMIHIKDIVGLLADPEMAEPNDTRELLDRLKRKILYVPPSMPVTDLLLRMQASRIHMALVIDEYGGTDGLVTIEDLIELIVGDIRDEHDEAVDFTLQKLGDNRWEADARAPLEDLSQMIGFDFRMEEHEADTLAGLVLSLAGRIPLRGEVLSHPGGYEFDVIDADPRSVHRIVIRELNQDIAPMTADAAADEGSPDPDPAGSPSTGTAKK